MGRQEVKKMSSGKRQAFMRLLQEASWRELIARLVEQGIDNPVSFGAVQAIYRHPGITSQA